MNRVNAAATRKSGAIAMSAIFDRLDGNDSRLWPADLSKKTVFAAALSRKTIIQTVIKLCHKTV